jgi:flagellar export protein FliJ
MQAFRFRLAKVLEWYVRQYEEEELRFGACVAALAEAQKSISALLAERVAVDAEMVARKSMFARDLLALDLYHLGVKKRELELNDLRDRCESALREQRERLQAAQRRVRLLEKLKERRQSEYVYAETRELDELAADAFFAKWAAK